MLPLCSNNIEDMQMDSINRNQPEDNYENLASGEAVEKIKEIVKKAQTCFFCTSQSVAGANSSRPMNVREVDDEETSGF